MDVIYKYVFSDELTMKVPDSNLYPLTVVHVGLDPQSRRVAIWVRMRKDSSKTRVRSFRVVGTGWDIEYGWSHVGSVIDGAYVWHVLMDVDTVPA